MLIFALSVYMIIFQIILTLFELPIYRHLKFTFFLIFFLQITIEKKIAGTKL